MFIKFNFLLTYLSNLLIYLCFNKKIEIMKLELKHIAPYLPYDINVFFKDLRKGEIKIFPDGSIFKMDLNNISYVHFDIERAFTEFKPILRPLSDLTINDYLKYGYTNLEMFLEDVKNETIYYTILKELLELHFDIFNLIENNLAININTL